MKIALFNLTNFFQVIGSTEPYYVTKFLAKNHKLHVFIPKDEKEKVTKTPPNVRVHRVPILRRIPTFISFNFLVMFQMLDVLWEVDIIYTYKGIFTPILLKFLFRKPWVCDFRSAPVEQQLEFQKLSGELSVGRKLIYQIGKSCYKILLRYSDLVMVISEEIGEEMITRYHVPSEKIQVVPVGVEIKKFSKEKENHGAKSLKLVYIGSIAKHRGLDTVITSLKRLQGMPFLRLVIVGDGPPQDVNALKEQAKSLQVKEMVDWKGYIPHEEIPQLLKKCSIALSPLPDLISYRVSNPVKVLEYMASGQAIIASDILAHRKLIRDGYNGLLFTPGNPDHLAAIIRRVCTNEKLRKNLQRNARDSVNEYDWKEILSSLELQLKKLSLT